MAAAANVVVAVVYLGIAVLIARPLFRLGQLRSNPLATATALLFLSGAVHHGLHPLDLLLPSFGMGEEAGRATRDAFGWPLAVSDLFAAVVGGFYLSLRRSYGRLLESGELYAGTARRQREALEINDTVVQGVVAAQLARRLGRDEELDRVLDATLVSARSMVDRLLTEVEMKTPGQGEFVRSEASRLRQP